jgi:hypothetical protein
MPLARVIALGAALSFLAGCTNVTRLSAGPAAAFPGEGRVSYGQELVLRRGIGTSDFEAIGVMEYETRLLVTEETQALAAGAGYSAMRWFGPALVFANLDPALGFELTRGKPLGNAGLHGALGYGWAFADERRQHRARWALLPEACGIDCDRQVTVERIRKSVTVELAGSVDVRGTREPLFTLGVLLGIAFTHEQDDFSLPPPTEGPAGLFRLPPTRR